MEKETDGSLSAVQAETTTSNDDGAQFQATVVVQSADADGAQGIFCLGSRYSTLLLLYNSQVMTK